MERFAIPGVGGILEQTIENVPHILIQERCKQDAPLEYGLLEIPTGKIREFENIFTCLRREVKEETGLDVLEIQGENTASIVECERYNVLNYTPFSSSQNVKGEYPIMAQIFICTVAGKLLTHTDETQNVRWMPLSELQRTLATDEASFYPMHIATLKKYLAWKCAMLGRQNKLWHSSLFDGKTMETLLEHINSPGDLKSLSEQQLQRLSREIRDLILSTVSKTGGHLASNLGIVELTVALHTVFDAPNDKLIWDVSHQAYPHKILTGRRDRFHTIRQHGGLSGFCKRSESAYDAYSAGHSSTSISAALGIAEARDAKGEDFHVIAVIGDGALTSGLAFEGLNNAGARRKKNFLVMLNDNEMSISRNVGALSGYLNRLITGNLYNRLKGQIEHILKAIPVVGKPIFRLGKRLDETLKGLIMSGTLFEQLGFKYVGPIDGHDLHQLLETFRNIRDYVERPTLVHVVTKKGKGYLQAEENSTAYHGAAPFQISTGEFTSEKTLTPSYTDIFGETLVELAENDPRIMAITAAMASGTGLEAFAQKFPARFFDVGIAEQHAVTFAAGLATEGFKPVVAIYSTFLQRAYDQIFHEVCLQNLPVVFAIDRGGLVGADGPTHHGVFDFAYLRHLPNMVIMSPKDENELRHMLKTALEYPGPVAIRYPKDQATGAEREQPMRSLAIGQAEMLKDGSDLTILAIGHTVRAALEAAKNLEEDDQISTAVINARFVKPLDETLILAFAEKTGRILTVEEHVLHGGFGSAVLEMLQAHQIRIPVQCLALPDAYIEHGAQQFLRHKYGIDADGIESAARKMLLK